MNESMQAYGAYAGRGAVAGDRNRVLRNTYWLLALSMIPTVLGAWIGVATGVAAAMTPGISLVVFLVGAFGLMYAIEKTKNSAAGVPVLLGFTFFMGLMLSRLIGAVLGLANGAGLIMMAKREISVVRKLPRNRNRMITTKIPPSIRAFCTLFTEVSIKSA